MGCDIHCYIEYKPKDSDHWRDFGGRINPGRNYWMFGAMAGVRATQFKYIEPRGFPNDVASNAFNDNTNYVDDDQKEPTKQCGEDYHYSRAHADEYVAKGYCHYVSRGEMENRWVTDCDHHTHSWLNADEFELAIASYLKESGFQIGMLRLQGPEIATALIVTPDSEKAYALSSITEYWAILAALHCFEAQNQEARLVFWFDN